MALKEKLMNKMMENQFSNMSTEEKQKMMDSMMEKFFAGMTDEERNLLSKLRGVAEKHAEAWLPDHYKWLVKWAPEKKNSVIV